MRIRRVALRGGPPFYIGERRTVAAANELDSRLMTRDGSYVARILVVDDEDVDSRQPADDPRARRLQGRRGLGGREALARVAQRLPDAVLLDIKMPEMDGLTVLQSMREKGYEMPVIMITGHGDIDTAVDATRRGAFDFFEKPLQRDRVLLSLRNAVESIGWRARAAVRRHEPDELVGSSPRCASCARPSRRRPARPRRRC